VVTFPKHTQGIECNGCNERLKDAHILLQSFFYQIKDKHPGVHCSCAFRGQVDQDHFFKLGKSELAWPNSKHNLIPSLAIDIFQVDHLGRAVFDPVFCARVYAESKTLGFDLRWGGDWNGDGRQNEKFKDPLHFELKENMDH